MTKKNFYTFILVALAVVSIIALYYLSKKSNCCDSCHAHIHQVERTFAIIKPDAVAAGKAQEIIKAIEDRGFTIVAQRELTIDKETAETFYGVHAGKPFFDELVAFITSGPVIVLALEKEDAISDWREFMGATNPAHAEQGTLRKTYGTDIGHNAVHGSDSAENATQELKLFFPELH
ncbi:MAG: nucleoside diphosphate kinase [Candidatus Babeliales bacterium]